MAKEIPPKMLLYLYDPEETYEYNINHGTEYPYNRFPKGINDRTYIKTRFINWEPIPEDIVIRHLGSQIFVNFMAVMPGEVIVPELQTFQLRAKRTELHHLICEQINFFTALYDDDNDLLTSMLIAKYITDSQTYTISTYMEYFEKIYETIFTERTLNKIRLMVEENDVGDNIEGLFSKNMIKDIYLISFMIKVMHIFMEHFIISTGNSPKELYEIFATCVKYMMDQINPNMYVNLYTYVNSSVSQTVKSNANVFDMQAIDGVTLPTITNKILRKTLICDGLIKLTFASEWDPVNKRPTYSCVGLIKAVVGQATSVVRKAQLRYSLVNVDNDISQLISDNISSASPISELRSHNPGEYTCMLTDLHSIIGRITLQIDIDPVEFYLKNLPKMNDLSKILINIVLYNLFHSTISTDTLSMKQKYILLLYVRYLIMDIYHWNEEDAKTNTLLNLLTGKVSNSSTRTLTQKDLNGIKKYIKLNDLKQYMLSEKDVNSIVERIMNCVLSSYTIVNHSDPDSLGHDLIYDVNTMMVDLLDMIVALFKRIHDINLGLV